MTSRWMVCAFAAIVLLASGCGTSDDGGAGGTAGSGGSAGSGGTSGSGGAAGTGGGAGDGGSGGSSGSGGLGGTGGADGVCDPELDVDGAACAESNECAEVECVGGTCELTPVANGTACGDDGGTCEDGTCKVACTAQAIREAVAEGGGPYTFDCGAPTTIVTESEIVIDNDVVLDGEGELTIDGAATHRVFSVAEGVKAELHGWTITNGRSQAVSRDERNHGGGIANYGTLLLHDSVITDNEAAPGGICNRVLCYNSGGGIFNSGSLIVVNAVVSQNSGFYGAGIGNEGTMTLSKSTVSDNLGADSGGVSSDGELTVMSSTISGNTGAGVSAAGLLEVTNSTISNNTGTGVSVRIGTASLTYTTISENSPEDAAIVFYPDAALEMTATLVVGPCEAILNSGVMSNGYNIESPDDTCGFDPDGTDQVDLTEGELNLGPLQNNGGPTETHALGAGSVGIDRIPAEDCEVTEDQRGEPRPETGGDACDVGAFERQPDDPPPSRVR